jgi:hypothetical protein
MDLLAPAQVRQLLHMPQGACVSIYMPTHRRGPDTWQNHIRLKNLLNDAERKLTATGMRSVEARDMLKQARGLVADSNFWRFQADGLAVFIASGTLRTIRLPIAFQELALVGSRFHLKPLFPMLVGDGLFYVLAISQNQARLLRCTRDTFEEIEAPEFAEGEESILKYVEEQKQLQWHTQTGVGGPGGKRAAVFHGQGAARHYKDRIFEYFRKIAAIVRRLIGGNGQAPLVFIGVDYLYPIFQQANDGLNLLDEFVAGSPDEDHTSAEALHRAARNLIEPYFDRDRQKSADLYRDAKGIAPHRATNDLPDALRAAHDGRISIAFTALDAHHWGRYNPMTGEVEFHLHEETGDEELLDSVAIQTFMHGGKVYAVRRDEMPERGNVAAVTRY